MYQKILIQSNLEQLKRQLEELGYNVVSDDKASNGDVYVYEADGNDINYYNRMKSSLDVQDTMFLINAKRKNIKEIDYMIKHRSYSPLF